MKTSANTGPVMCSPIAPIRWAATTVPAFPAMKEMDSHVKVCRCPMYVFAAQQKKYRLTIVHCRKENARAHTHTHVNLSQA